MEPVPNPAAVSSSEKSQKFSSILGLPIDDEPVSASSEVESNEPRKYELTVIIPARNEEANLPACLASLLAQDDEFFELGKDWELLVVDDDSTDNTRALAEEAAIGRDGMKILQAPPLEKHPGQRQFTGKNNACWTAAQVAEGRWLLFTDADTIHKPGDLTRALHEAAKHNVSMLSYSPRQIVTGFWQAALMALIFSELASVYPPDEVNDPSKRIAAANGQFLMVEQKAYFAVGGHKAVGKSVLEDVDLAYNIKRSKRGIRLRYAPDALKTRMYRGVRDMIEGWTKNLAQLFPHALTLAAWRILDILLLLLPVTLWLFPHLIFWQQGAILLLWVRTLVRFYSRVARAHFGFRGTAISVAALPLFSFLLIKSWIRHKIFHQVTWKGREYRTGA